MEIIVLLLYLITNYIYAVKLLLVLKLSLMTLQVFSLNVRLVQMWDK